ncbi:hypothetical protein APHAL10511_008588 [Amanita phalloides]|nr:hypothetical protein APHAL10511_008588 [Amanita phalloides]
MPTPQANQPKVFSVPRLTTLIASLIVSLGSGTNYVFSAYSPQLGSRLNINHTQLNIIGLAGNIGVYSSGPIWGRFVDLRGPRIPLLSAFFLLLIGYYGIRHIYDQGLSPGETTVSVFTFILLVLFGLMSGAGGNAGIASAINSTAKTFPDSARATTVGIVLSGFGLSAFLFSSISHIFFPGDTSSFLLILAVGTAFPMIMGYFLVRPIPLQRSTSPSPFLSGLADRVPISTGQIGIDAPLLEHDDLIRNDDLYVEGAEAATSTDVAPSPHSQFVSRRRALLAGDIALTNIGRQRLVRSTDFWLLFSILSLLSGTGIMYINNVGSMSQALYAKETPIYDDIRAFKWQTTQVSVISVMNFAGRIFLGMICDYGKNKLGIPRSYSLVLVSFIVFISQVITASIERVRHLWIASAVLGLGYGSTYSLFATMCLEWFGMPHFSENWGYLTLAPMVAGNILSIMFGRNLDAHESESHLASAPPRCVVGRECYVDTVYVTVGACFLSILLSLWACWRDREKIKAANVSGREPLCSRSYNKNGGFLLLRPVEALVGCISLSPLLMDPFEIEETSIPAVKSLRSRFEQLASEAEGAVLPRRRVSSSTPVEVLSRSGSGQDNVDASGTRSAGVKRPLSTLMGIKRPPPPPPQAFPVQMQTTAPTPRRVSPSMLSSSPGGRPHSPSVSPFLRPVPAPLASTSTTSLNGLLGAPGSRSSSRNGNGSDSGSVTASEEMEESQQAYAASCKTRLYDMNTLRQRSSMLYPSSDHPIKPAIPPRPPKSLDGSPRLLSSSPDEFTSPPSVNVSPPRCMLSSPFSDDETEVERTNLTAPLIPTPVFVRKSPPPKSPPAARSLDSHHSNSSQSSSDMASVSSTGTSVGSINRVPPPRPPPRNRPKAPTVDQDPSSPIPSNSSSKFINPPPLPSRRPNAAQAPDHESSTPSSTLTPSSSKTARSQQSPPQSSTSTNTSTKQDSPSTVAERKSLGSSKHPPPPTRIIALGDKLPPARRSPPFSSDDESAEEGATFDDIKGAGSDSLPDTTRSSQRPPVAAPFRNNQLEAPKIPIQPYGGHYVVAGSMVAVSQNHHIRIYDLSVSDGPMITIDTKELGSANGAKVTCMEMKGTGDGMVAWVGTKEGQVFEVNLRNGSVSAVRQAVHMNPVTHILRYGLSMVTLDEGGKALVFAEGETVPRVVRITEKQDFVRMLGGRLWTAARAESQSGMGGGSSRLPIVRIYDVFVPGSMGRSAVPTEHVGAVTSAAVVPSQPGKVYVGHEEGYVSVWAAEGTEDGYPRCLEVVKVSASDVLCLEGVNDRLWVGSRNGAISAFEVGVRPWALTNSWSAHPGLPVLKLAVDTFGLDEGRLNVVSVGRDETLRFWDGLLASEWIEHEVQKKEDSFSSFRDITTLVFSWNCDAARPDSLNGGAANVSLFSDVLSSVDEPPDIIVFGFQEVIDLESRKMAAKNVLLGGAGKKKKHHDEGVTGIACSSNGLSDKVTGAYRRWYDRLVKEVRVAMPAVSYTVVYTASLVGLFSCIFIKTSERFGLRDVAVTTIKRGMGGRYGNKGGIVARLVIGDSSVCMINCHLAAGQNAVRRRNADMAAILEEKAVFPATDYPLAYVGGGDGTTILDHEIVLVNGDMNYRIDHRREAIISSIRAGEFTNLLAHDQLLREIKSNRSCRIRGFSEGPITFAPTYKYDPRSSEYDSSEKRRLPAWCDRVLWRVRDSSRVQQLHYRRYEADVSDHRPISAAFRVTIKMIEHDLRGQALKQVGQRWAEKQVFLLAEARRFYGSYSHP